MAIIGGGSFGYDRLQGMEDMSRFVPPGGFQPQAPVEGVQPQAPAEGLQPPTHEKVEETDEARQAAISDSLMRPTDSVSLSSTGDNGGTQPVGELSSKDMMAQLRATGLNIQGNFGGWG